MLKFLLLFHATPITLGRDWKGTVRRQRIKSQLREIHLKTFVSKDSHLFVDIEAGVGICNFRITFPFGYMDVLLAKTHWEILMILALSENCVGACAPWALNERVFDFLFLPNY